MKKVLSTIVAALVAMSFSAVVFAADMPAGHPAPAAADAKPAVEKKEEAPKAEAAPAAK
jgi:Spy/CpxP family protein refolding chaperone